MKNSSGANPTQVECETQEGQQIAQEVNGIQTVEVLLLWAQHVAYLVC